MSVVEYGTTMRRRGLAASTVGTRLRCLHLFEAWLERDLLTAEPGDVERFLDGKRLGPRSRYNWISHLSSYYRWCVDHELCDRDPTVRVERPKLPRLLPRPITEADLAVAVEVAQPNRLMYAWLVLAGWAGLRCAEIAGLTADAVMLDDGLLRILGKGGKERVVPTHPKVVDALLYHGVPRQGYVFRRPRGARWFPEGVSREASAGRRPCSSTGWGCRGGCTPSGTGSRVGCSTRAAISEPSRSF